jgi:hypothetical protein
VLPEELRVRGQDVGGEEEEEADLEAQFSDDEAVRLQRYMFLRLSHRTGTATCG